MKQFFKQFFNFGIFSRALDTLEANQANYCEKKFIWIAVFFPQFTYLGGSQQFFWPWTESSEIKIWHRRQTLIPWYYTIFSTYDQSLFFHWLPGNSHGKPLIWINVEYLEIWSDTLWRNLKDLYNLTYTTCM